ncbi:MAG: anti-anti-sigma factor [Planctomycetaceae bacterium]|nr:anti-anti-sigma factor [Planctomycetaceae bacterium]
MDHREGKHDQNIVVALTGRLDVLASSELETRLLTAIENGVKTLVLDVAALEYISSAGLRVLIVVAKKVRADGGDMVFASAGPNIMKILEISGFTKMFKMVASPNDVLSAT